MESVLLGDVVRVVKRAVEPEPGTTYRQAGVRLWGVGAYEREPIDGGDTSYKHFYQIREGDLIVNKIWARNGSVAVVPPELDGCYVSGEFPTFEADRSRVSPDWLRWIAKSSLLWDQFDERSHGTSGKNRIQPKKVLAAQIPLPPLDQQARRAEKVEYLSALAEQTARRLGAQVADLAALRQRILDDAVRGRLTERDADDEPAEALLKRIADEKQRRFKAGEIRKPKPLPPVGADEAPFEVPEGWMWTRLGEVGNWGAGATPSRGEASYYDGGSIPWLKTGELNDGVIGSAEEYVTDFALSKCSLRLNQPGSVLIAMYGATIGKLGMLEIEATTNQACCACEPIAGFSKWYLFYFLLSKRQDFRDLGAGGAQPNVSKAKLIFEPVPVPPVEEQRRIVERVDGLMVLCDRLDARLGAATEDAGRLAQAVLAEALAG